MADARVPMDPLFSAFGVPATVTRPAPDDDPITTTVVWINPIADDVPIGQAFQRREQRRILALDRAAVPTVPRGTEIVAPEALGGSERTWKVDSHEQDDVDHYRVRVVPVSE